MESTLFFFFFLLLRECVWDTVSDRVIVILTAVEVRTLCDVAVGSENQLHVLDDALETQRGRRRRKTMIGKVM